MSLKLQEGAILIADAHCAPWRTPFIDFLRALESGEIHTPQLILMGDVFDLLFGPIPSTHTPNHEAIALLNRLSEKIEILYLEGNHDFLLTKLFRDIVVVPRQNQPLVLEYADQKIALSHGDTQMGIGYEIYTALIRNRFILGMLRTIDTIGGGWIVARLEEMMKRKSHCRPIDRFESIISRRLEASAYEGYDVLIEGHFHQNRSIQFPHMEYINLGAFACNERYFTVQSIQNKPLLDEAVFRKEPR